METASADHLARAEGLEATVDELRGEGKDKSARVEELERKNLDLLERLRAAGQTGEESKDLFRIVKMARFAKDKLVDREHIKRVLLDLFEKHELSADGEIAWPSDEAKEILAELWSLHDLEPWP